SQPAKLSPPRSPIGLAAERRAGQGCKTFTPELLHGIRDLRKISIKICAACTHGTPVMPLLDRWPTALFIGDSLTEFGFSPDGCWLARVAHGLRRRCDLRVRGFSGYTTRWWRASLPRLLPASCPCGQAGDTAACVVFLGANDSSRGAAKPTLHVPLTELKDNLGWILRELMLRLSLTPDKLLLISIPPVDEAAYKPDCEASGFPFDKFLADCEPYNRAIRDVAHETGVELVDIFNPIMEHENWQQLFADGIHFNAKGSELVFNCVWPAIERRVSHLPVMLPDFEEAAAAGFDEALASWSQRVGLSTN
uniref:Isoamyl acetate-hydrolyzing esterase 1 homolog n=2 Tax=Macrostomum lignano TaxID=282301 RepID=A0A1I8GTN1_9PLAT